MGGLSKLFTGGGTALVNSTKAGNLDANTVMAAQTGQITPDKPGSWKHLAVPIPSGARQFSATEHQAILSAAAEAQAKEKFTDETYASIRKMSKSYRKANVAHEETRRAVAIDSCLSAKERAESAGLLHDLRPQIASSQRRLEGRRAKAEGAIKAYA